MTAATPTPTPVVADLMAALGPEVVIVDVDVVAAHGRDTALFCPAGKALALVRPRTTAEVAQVVTICRRHGTPIVPQGARTGISGGANAVDGCVLVSLMRLDRILEINKSEQIAVVQPGVINATLSRAVAEVGLFYPPDPSSWEMSSLGGNVSTNAGGLCCVKYGVTTDYVRALEVVTGAGEVVRTGRRTAKGVAGLDLTSLLVGAEGTLGLITEITLALRPAAEEPLTMMAGFATMEESVAAVAEVMASGVGPSLCEFLDDVTTRAINEYRNFGLDESVGALLIMQSDRGPLAAEDCERMAEICRRHGAVEVAVASDAQESRMLLQARRSVNPALEPLGLQLVDDVAVPRERLVELVSGMKEIGRRCDVLISCSGHVGDGNMHPTVHFPPGDADAERRALEAFDAIMDLGLALGGTITGEHGVGVLKRDHLARELGPVSVRLHQGIRDVFDPDRLLNPGKVLG